VIDYFLSCTAQWTPQWFNKPKFHLLHHLLAHVHWFGPAILFATKGFESFNAVVHDHSVHSNHLTPSHDIGQGMAWCNHICHLLSGGFFIPHSTVEVPTTLPFSDNVEHWQTAGPHVLALCRPSIAHCNVIADYLGFILLVMRGLLF